MAAAAAKKSLGISGEITPDELTRRVAVLKRFRELLSAQRDRFRTYLESLDRQKDAIEGGNAEDLLRHVELEEKIVADIFSIQKVIDPLERMYLSVKTTPRTARGGEAENDEVSGLREALEGLKGEAAARSKRNRELLVKQMAALRSEIKSLQGSLYATRRFTAAAAPGHIDIRG